MSVAAIGSAPQRIVALPTVRSNSRGSAVSQLQSLLADKGFKPGPADGVFGPRTLAAVKAFQRSRGLAADGIVGPKTWAKLQAAAAPRPPAPAPAPAKGMLKLGSKGPRVASAQQALVRHGFNPGPVDGRFGNQTAAAVRRFQASRGLTVDGIVGPKTSAALAGTGFVPAPEPTAPTPAPAPSGPVRNRIVALARAELARGVREDAGEDRDSAGRIVDYRRAVTGPGENPHAREAWCADFASFIYRSAGVPLGRNGQGEDYVPFLRDWARSVGRYHTRGAYTPRAGDLILFSYGGVRPDHVAVVVKVEGGRVYTIGGNEGDAVRSKSYELGRSSILGYVTPPPA